MLGTVDALLFDHLRPKDDQVGWFWAKVPEPRTATAIELQNAVNNNWILLEFKKKPTLWLQDNMATLKLNSWTNEEETQKCYPLIKELYYSP